MAIDQESLLDSGLSSFLGMLRSWYPRLTEAERRAADYILANPDRILLSSITEVAAHGAVGASTLTRLAAKLGFAGYPEMRTALAVELLNRDETDPRALHEDDAPDAVTGKVVRLAIQNLRDTLGLLDPDHIRRAAGAIARARRVELYANCASTAAMARLAEHRLLVAGISCAVFDRSAQIQMASGLLGSDDVAIGLSHSGEGPDVAPALRAARESGATTICLTNVPNSSVTRFADIVLLTAAWTARPKDDHPVASMVGMTAAIDVLYANVVLLRHARASTDGQPRSADAGGAAADAVATDAGPPAGRVVPDRRD